MKFSFFKGDGARPHQKKAMEESFFKKGDRFNPASETRKQSTDPFFTSRPDQTEQSALDSEEFSKEPQILQESPNTLLQTKPIFESKNDEPESE